ncbi:MAG: integrase [Rhodospirillaceae bacterium]|nr:integrase [Rhodospirillaceae bacterium]
MSSIMKIKGGYQARVRRKNYPTKVKNFQYKSDAKKWAETTERAMATGQFSFAEGTLGELLKRYGKEITPNKRSFEIEILRIKKINRSWLGKIPLTDLRSFHIAQYRDERLKVVQGNAAARDLSLISDAINTAMREWNIRLTENPVSLVTKPPSNRPRDRRLGRDEAEGLLLACSRSHNSYLFPLVIVALETAMRRGELLTLQRNHIYYQSRTAYLPLTKNGERRTVPLSSKAIKTLEELPANISGRVFPLSTTALRGLWKRACKRAGIDDLRFHDLRHEATSRFFERGLNVMEVSTITGHKDLRMLKRYTHLRAEDLALKLG